MRSNRSSRLLRRTGGILLLAGGVLWVLGYDVPWAPGTTTSSALGAVLTALEYGAPIGIGVGLGVTGLSLRGGAGFLLVVAGAAALLGPALELAQDALTGPPDDPRPGPFGLLLLEILTVVLAAVHLSLQRSSPRALRSMVAPAAAGYALFAAIGLVPGLGVLGVVQLWLPGVGALASGVLVLRAARTGIAGRRRRTGVPTVAPAE